MLPRVDANVAPLVPARGTPAAEAAGEGRQAVFQRALQGLVGQSMQGEIMSRLTDGSYVVKVQNMAARMMLPAGAEPGKQVPLTLVSVDPRPTFQVGNGPNPSLTAALAYPPDPETPAAQPGASGAAGARASLGATLLGKAPLTPANLLPDFDPGAPAPTLSPAGRAISNVLIQADNRPGAQAIVGSTALATHPADTPQLAQKLQQAVGTSGLFYESHVAEWADGKRPMAELLREPQMQKAAGGEAAPRQAGTPDQASAQLINQQLHAHEQGRVLWQGEAWPGQRMEWDISKDPAQQQRGRASDGQAAPVWRSGVRFQFPALGAVTGSVVLVGGQVQIQIQAGSQASADALRAHASRLQEALAAAGSPLTSLSIGQQPAASQHTFEAEPYADAE